jgi:hypothetical protein
LSPISWLDSQPREITPNTKQAIHLFGMVIKLGKYDNCTNQRKVKEVHSSDEENIPSNIQVQTCIHQTSSVNNRDAVSSKSTISSRLFIFEQAPTAKKQNDTLK